MSVMSVGQRPGATGGTDEAGDLASPARPGHRLGGRKRPGPEPCARSRLEREMRSSKPLARELRAHQRLTGELRARGSLARQPRGSEPRGGVPQPRETAPARRGQAVRLTRRGRRVIAGFAAAVALAAAAALWLAAATGAQAANHGVAPGERLWVPRSERLPEARGIVACSGLNLGAGGRPGWPVPDRDTPAGDVCGPLTRQFKGPGASSCSLRGRTLAPGGVSALP